MVFTSSLRSNSDRADFCNCWVLRDGGNRTKSAKITLPVHGRKHTTKRYWCEGRASSIAPLSYEEPIASGGTECQYNEKHNRVGLVLPYASLDGLSCWP